VQAKALNARDVDQDVGRVVCEPVGKRRERRVVRQVGDDIRVACDAFDTVDADRLRARRSSASGQLACRGRPLRR